MKYVLIVLAALALFGCEEDYEPEPDDVVYCAPNSTETCVGRTCPEGTRMCHATGDGWGVCQCPLSF